MPTERNILGELLSSVDLLTKNRVDVLTQERGNVRWLTRVEQEALLVQLRRAITSSVGSHPIGGTLPNHRSVLDSDALDKYENICKQITKMYGRVTSARPFSYPEQNLRIWYIEISNRYNSGKLSRESVISDIKKLESWANLIDEKLNPPQTLEIIVPCPECGATWAKNNDNEKVSAVFVTFRPSQTYSLAATKASCRACMKEWKGANEIRALGETLEKTKVAIDQ